MILLFIVTLSIFFLNASSGHIKTVLILAGGCLFFGDEMPLKKLLGIAVAMAGIIWYSQAGGGKALPRGPRALRSLPCWLGH